MEYDFHAVFSLDSTTGVLYWKSPPKNHAEKTGAVAGAVNKGKGKNKDYWQVSAFGKTFKRSRVVFAMTHGRWPEPMVDHINGDSLDDRPANLRQCTASENNFNAAYRRKYDLPRGVYQTRQGRYMARFMNKSLGVFDAADDASAVYLRAKTEAANGYA